MSDRIKGWDGPFEPALPSLDDNHYYHGFNKRQRAAIDLRVPDSGTPWLDEMIRQALRQELAGKALVGVTQGWFNNPGSTSACVEIANDLADALLARIGGAK